MRSKLKVYHGTLLAKGPVFVGSGRKLPKKEYVLINGRTGIGVIDPIKAYRFFRTKGLLHKYEEFMMRDDIREDLQQFLYNNRIRINELNSCFAYTLDAGDALKENGRRTEIGEIIKDPYGLPYIPGSSLKGMFRTILLSDDVMREQAKYARRRSEMKSGAGNYRGRTGYLSKEMASLEAQAFRTLDRPESKPSDAVNDVLSGLIVSDSKPLAMKDCVVCKKIDVHTDGTAKPLPIARECLRPGSRIEFDVTVDTSVLDLDADRIMKAVKNFNLRYRSAYERKFAVRSQLTDNTVFLGGGSGFVSKTVVYPLLGYQDGLSASTKILSNITPPKHKHRTDSRKGVSPHVLKCTKYNGRLLEMGACELTFS